jgi:hypothetical protein
MEAQNRNAFDREQRKSTAPVIAVSRSFPSAPREFAGSGNSSG